MTDFTDEVRTLLLNDAALSALVSDRIYAVFLPQATGFPALTYQVVSSQRINTWDGPLGDVKSRLQFDIWAKSYPEVQSAFRALRELLDGYKTVGAGAFRAAFIGIESDFYEPDTELFRKSTDFWIDHIEAAP